MLGLDYGSDSDNSPPPSPKQKPKTPATKSKAPKKIAISLPALAPTSDDEGQKGDEPPSKKRKTGAGSSALMSMLPAPKKTAPSLPPPQRVLGGGTGRGLVFNTPASSSVTSPASAAVPSVTTETVDPTDQKEALFTPSTMFMPTHIARGKKNINLEDGGTSASQIRIHSTGDTAPTAPPAVDFFSLRAAALSPSPSVAPSANSAHSQPPSLSVSSAPQIETFEPPEPTRDDPYPGYYQLPTGAWAAYDREYSQAFVDKWAKEYNDYIWALEKGKAKGFESMDEEPMQEVDALREMEKAKKEVQEREEKKALTKGAAGAPAAPRMTINASKLSGIARSRHQLSTLLKEAYENREALEEKIAMGKRNRKEAGNKYGF